MSGLLKHLRQCRQKEQPGTQRTNTPESASTRDSQGPPIEGPPESAEIPQRALTPTNEYLDVSKDANPLVVEAKKQYNEAIMAFDKAFELYASKIHTL
jgi:hypothetical protein